MKMMAGHWIFMEIMALTVLQAQAKFDYLPRSVKSSDPFTLISDGDDNTCMAIPNTRPTRMQMSVPEPWVGDVAWFSIRGRHVGCQACTSAPEKLYLMPLMSPLSLTDQSAGGVRKICTLEESELDGTMENHTYSCMCPANCSHVYLVHLDLHKPEWELCAWEFKGIGACGFIECLNGGSCVNLGDRYTCSCPEGYTGQHCETDTRPNCTELGSAAAVAVYDSATAGMILGESYGISISSITGSVVLADRGGQKVHIMDAELDAGNVIDQYSPYDTTYDDKGFLYVTDCDGHKVHVYDSNGNETLSFGSEGTGPGQFSHPHCITYKAGVLPELYVCDYDNQRVQVYHTNGTFIAEFGAPHFGNGPVFIVVDTNIYVSDASGTFYIFTSTYTLTDKFIFNESPLYSRVSGIALYNGCLIVADWSSNHIKVFDPDFFLVATIGSLGSSVGQLNQPQGIAVTHLGAIYVVDTLNNRVQLFKLL